LIATQRLDRKLKSSVLTVRHQATIKPKPKPKPKLVLWFCAKEPRYVVVPVVPSARHADTRLCLAQKTHGGPDSDVWAIDSLRLMQVKPTVPIYYVQFSLHLMCGLNARRGGNNRCLRKLTTLGRSFHARVKV